MFLRQTTVSDPVNFKVLLNLLKVKARKAQRCVQEEGGLAYSFWAGFMSALRPLARHIINIKDTCPGTEGRTVVARQYETVQRN